MAHTNCYKGHDMWNGDGKTCVWAYNGGLVQTRSVTARYPKKLSSGFADGCFKVKYYD